jgi:pimeloyl-ACP methyl ester carboxylesterase
MSKEHCTNGSVSTCGLHFDTISLAEALSRFKCEAVRCVCDTGRYRCPLYVWGDGPNLVFVPGLADDGLSFAMPMALLSRQFRCISYDWPSGEGDGAHLASYRHRDFASDLLAVVDQVAGGEAFVHGYSFGASVALAAMHARPAAIPRAALLGGFACRRLAPAEIMLASLARYWKGPLRRLPFRERLMHETQALGFDRREPAAWDFFIERTGGLPMAALARRALILHRLDLRPVLSTIQQPILLVCGDGDPLVNKRCEAELLTGLQRVLRVELERCGHEAIYTHPEALAQAVGDFLLGGWRVLSNGVACAHGNGQR